MSGTESAPRLKARMHGRYPPRDHSVKTDGSSPIADGKAGAVTRQARWYREARFVPA